MLVTDFKRDFYSVVKRKHVLILCSYEVDSVCCCKILQFIFEEDDTTYSLVPVTDAEALLKAYMEYNSKVCYVILINCGATINLMDLLQPSPETVFYVIDKLLISLYRHWTLYDSIRLSRTTASFFRSWTLKGSMKLNEFFVHAGLPLTECRQEYNMMEVDLRNESKGSLENTFERYKIRDVVYGSFYAKYAYSHKLSAGDMSEALAAILFFDKEPCSPDSFFSAMNSLSKCQVDKVYVGIRSFQAFLETAFNETRRVLNDGSVQDYHSFLVCHIGLDSTAWKYFSHPYGIYAFGRYVQSAYVSSPRSRRHKSKPFVITVALQNRESTILVAGVPPLYVQTSEDKPRNLFGQAFLRIAEGTTCRIRQKFFESHVVELYAEDTDRFLTGIVGLLQD